MMHRTVKVHTVEALTANAETRQFETLTLSVAAPDAEQAVKIALRGLKKAGTHALSVSVTKVEKRLYSIPDEVFFANATYTVVEE